MKTKKLLIPVMLMLSSIFFIQCAKDDDTTPSDGAKGQLTMSITDAPSDDANVKGTFVTISEVKIDGKTVEGFTKQTIEISAYQNGNAKLLYDGEVEAKAHSSVTLVMDYESDASGNSPGCYVLTNDNQKHRLAATSETKGEISLSKAFVVEENSNTELVIDFDLRKSIVHDTNDQDQTDYRFVTKAELNNSIRIMKKESCGDVKGKITASAFLNEDVYVFIYKKGQYNASVETMGQGSSHVFFAKAVTSAEVEQDGDYHLAFIEEGDYEVYIAKYEKDAANKSVFKGMVNATSAIPGLLLNNIQVSAQSQIQLNINVTGIN